MSLTRLSTVFLLTFITMACGDGAGPVGQNGDNSAPSLTILAPAADDIEVLTSETVRFAAIANDPEDGNLGTAIEWASDLDGVLGSGAEVVATLTQGVHTVTASVRDSGGREASGSRTVRAVPFTWTSVTVGSFHSCAVAHDGRAYCWGLNEYDGQLGVDSIERLTPTPTPVDGDHRFSSLDAGGAHTCGVLQTGGAMCWGATSDEEGILGSGSLDGSRTPTSVQASSAFTNVTGGHQYNCGLDNAGVGYCWGWNWASTLGIGADPTQVDEATTPQALDTPARFERIVAGISHACALTAASEIHCWGSSGSAEIGDGQVRSWATSPMLAAGGPWTAVAPAAGYTAALDEAGRPWYWGSRTAMTSGGGGDRQLVPDTLPTEDTYTDLVAGGSYVCGLTSDGRARCWGSGYSQTPVPGGTQPAPVDAGGAHRYVQLAVHGAHACGLTEDGKIFCWGNGGSGQLGHGSTVVVNDDPVEVVTPGG